MFHLKHKFLNIARRTSYLGLSLLTLLMASSASLAFTRPAYAAPVSNKCAKVNSDCNCDTSTDLNPNNCGIVYYIWLIINVLSALTGIVLVISLIAAGIQWTTAGDNPQQLSAAKTRIVNMLIALFLFAFTYAFLQWVVPGGVF